MNRIRIVVLGLMMGLTACLGDDDGGNADCARAASRLRECGLLTEGEFSDCDPPETPFRQCRFDCALAASCDDLRAAQCDDIVGPTLVACEQRCLDRHGFTCGSGERIREDWRCDGGPDCVDGSDEVGCMSATFTCDNGSIVQADGECDGFNDCADGSDESACPTFQCSDGSMVPLDYHCDGYVDCADAGDELDGCPTFRCDDGTELPLSLRCDEEPQCVDESDERGCPIEAELICN